MENEEEDMNVKFTPVNDVRTPGSITISENDLSNIILYTLSQEDMKKSKSFLTTLLNKASANDNLIMDAHT